MIDAMAVQFSFRFDLTTGHCHGMTLPFRVPLWVVRCMKDNERLLAEIVRVVRDRRLLTQYLHAYMITDPAPDMGTMPCAIIKWPWGKANKVLADNVYRIAACAAVCGRNGLKVASDGDSFFLRFLESGSAAQGSERGRSDVCTRGTRVGDSCCSRGDV
jgi:hypothetical protein